jgi:GT2 family glycosyltransferase
LTRLGRQRLAWFADNRMLYLGPLLEMDTQRWRLEQGRLREAVRAHRRAADGTSSLAPVAIASSPGVRRLDLIGAAAGNASPASALAHLAQSSSSIPVSPTRGDRAQQRDDAVIEAVPLASVIVVCWNSAHVLRRCLDRLLAQDYANYEIIVVDDGSQDNTLEVAQDALARGEGAVVRSPLNRGCPHARNLGLRHANGEIIAFIDADGFAAPDWLRHIVAAFDADATIGGAASTVFFDGNPLVINGAGGTVNRQGCAADLSMNESYERAEIASEALYPMGCGMAVRRSAVERVGPFDDRILNYYDDVDYGVRLWRAGFRVVVARDAWIDHDFSLTGGDLARKRLLCEQHRMRVVLKHASVRTLAHWTVREALATTRARSPNRALKLRAMTWNARRLPSVLASRWRERGAPRAPDRLVDRSWGDGFPTGVPLLLTPRPETAGNSIDMADPRHEGQLLHGWFPLEHVNGRSFRWAGVHAAALIQLEAPAKRLRIDFTPAPADIGGIDVRIRRLGSSDPLAPVWTTSLLWQNVARSVENHPLALCEGDYEIVFSARQGWSDPRHDSRSLGFALASVSFEQSNEIACGSLDMTSPTVEEQLVNGWFDAEESTDRSYRWAGEHAAVVVRLAESASNVCLDYCLPPGPTGGLNVSVCPLDQPQTAWSTHIAWIDASWRHDSFPLRLAAGDYLVSFNAETTWSNPEGQDPAMLAENRSLGFALSSLSFGGSGVA